MDAKTKALIETARAREMRLVDGRLVELRNPAGQNMPGLAS